MLPGRQLTISHTALRLRGPTASANRTALRDCSLPLGGDPNGQSPSFIQKGDTLQISMVCMHHDRDFWGPDAEEFRPERWETIRPLWEYTPFLGGPRLCPAQQLVFTQAAFTVVRMLQKFRAIENRDPEPNYLELNNVAVENRTGCIVGLVRA